MSTLLFHFHFYCILGMADIVQISAHCAAELNARQAKADFAERSLTCARSSRESAINALQTDSSNLLQFIPAVRDVADKSQSAQLSITAARASHHLFKTEYDSISVALARQSSSILSLQSELSGESGEVAKLTETVKVMKAMRAAEDVRLCFINFTVLPSIAPSFPSTAELLQRIFHHPVENDSRIRCNAMDSLDFTRDCYKEDHRVLEYDFPGAAHNGTPSIFGCPRLASV